jgi:integrase
MADELRELRAQRTAQRGGIVHEDEHVFKRRLGHPYREFPRGAFTSALKRAGLEERGITPHSMRHTFATHFVGQSEDVQSMLGHADLATTEIYRSPLQDRMRTSLTSLDYGLKAGIIAARERNPDAIKGRKGS